MGTFMYVFLTVVYTIAIHFCISWCGSLYVKAELPRIGNESILNGLKESVFVTDEENQSILFQNKSAKNLNAPENNNLNSTDLLPDKDGFFNMKKAQFAIFDSNII